MNCFTKSSEAKRAARALQQLKRASRSIEYSATFPRRSLVLLPRSASGKSNHQFDTENSKIVENPVIDLAKSNRPMDLQFRPDIEGLRAIAVSLVVLHHSGFPFLRGSFIGADVFFVF